MKNALRENYNINEKINILENNNYCSFLFGDRKYYFMPYIRSDDELEDLISMNDELLRKDIPTFRFILNKNNQYLTEHLNKKYILFETPLNLSQEYDILDMLNYSHQLVINNKKSLLYRNRWAQLWSSKIDYFEYQVAELGKNKPLIVNSFSYYVGLAENAISYVNNTLKKHQISIYEKITLQRKRIAFPNILLNYFNPLNYIIDIEVRDIASYFKSLFFNSDENLWLEINTYLKRKSLSIYGYQLLYARLLYPSYYFDIYEKVMEDKIKEEELLKIINKSSSYEQFLKKIFLVISKYAPIEPIDWLISSQKS